MKYASILTNDPDSDPTPRVALRRKYRNGTYVWLDSNDNFLADGATPADANETLKHVYSFYVARATWDLRFHRNPQEF